MAALESIKGSPVAALMHNLRERETYQNPDIDQARTSLNYCLSPSSHGRTTKECMDYYDKIKQGVYHRGRGTITTAQWVVTAPKDLPIEKELEFFKLTYDFISHFHFDGDDSRCLLAQVHKDESEIGQSHMHYIFTLPEVENKKHITLEEKCLKGIKKAQEHFGEEYTKEQINDIYQAVQRYENSRLSGRERYAIHDIGDTLGIKRDDARWVFTKVRRLDSERFPKRLMAKDEFLTKEVFRRFHPEYQAWMDEHGFECSVYKGGTNINLTVDQLKEMTRETGYQLVQRGEMERLQEKVKVLEAQTQKWGVERKASWGREEAWER